MVSKKSIQICCAIIQTPISSEDWDNTHNKDKIKLLEFFLKTLSKSTDILILPAGFLNTSNKKPQTIFDNIEKIVVELIVKHCPQLNICLGIDGRYKNDQLLLTINKKGIVAIARKFHHMDNSIELADNAFTLEQSKPRHFELKNKKAYLAVCYDIFGIAPENKNNYDFIIAAIHGFGKSGGDSDFARKGLAGASKQWNVHSYASAVFSDNRNPTNWTSGVEWKHGDESVNNFKYDDIRLENKRQIVTAEVGTIFLDYYEE
jgi:predicted amidohydrolase